VLTTVLSALPGGLGALAPRLLARATRMVKKIGSTRQWTRAVDKLTKSWMGGVVSDFSGQGWTAIQDTVMASIKDAPLPEQGSGGFETTAESTWDWSTHLKEGLHTRSADLKEAMLDVIRKADEFTVPAAQTFDRVYRDRVPFLTEHPTEIGPQFEQDFGVKAELEMWIAWGILRDEKYWRVGTDGLTKQDERRAMWPIQERLLALGVPAWEISTVENIVHHHEAQILNMARFIEWAKRKWRRANTSYRPIQIEWLKLSSQGTR
jgi:hypothetical protein